MKIARVDLCGWTSSVESPRLAIPVPNATPPSTLPQNHPTITWMLRQPERG